MIINRLQLDGQQFFLDAAQDLPGLKAQILTAARGVADFIVFTPVGHGEVSVLMTPTTTVRFESEEHDDEQLTERETVSASSFDTDFDL